MILADRRTTVNGAPADDEFNKVCVFFCDDARLVLAFTGLATTSGFNASDWLAETLADIGKTKSAVADVLAELGVRASDRMRSVQANDRRLSFLACGYVYWGDTPRATAYVLSNFADRVSADGAFTLRSIAPQDGVLVEVAGSLAEFPEPTERTLRDLLSSNLPPTSVLRSTVLAGPDIRKRDPCWCGSGQKFKHCHMKKFGFVYLRPGTIGAFKKPLYSFTSMKVDIPRASGTVFSVGSGYD